jgi:hypothetical protein
MRNIGLEVQANARVLQTRDWQVDVGGNYAFNRNRVQSLGDPNITTLGLGNSFGGRTVNAVVGQQLGVIRGSDWARCRYTDATNTVSGVDINAACRTANAPDGALYIGANGFPVQDPTERTVGDPNPNFTVGFRTGVTFKRLSVNSFWDMRRGGTVQNMTKASMYNYGTHGDTTSRVRTGHLRQDTASARRVVNDAVVGCRAARSLPIDENGTGTAASAVRGASSRRTAASCGSASSRSADAQTAVVQRRLGLTRSSLRARAVT